MSRSQDAAFAFSSFVITVGVMALLWVCLQTLLRRFVGERIRILDRILYFIFAVVFNVMVWYLAVTLCTAGLKQFLPNITGTASQFLQLLLSFASGIPEVKGLKPYEVIGVAVGTVSLVVTHLLYAALIALSRWVGYEFHGTLAVTRADVRNLIEAQHPDLPEQQIEEQANRQAVWAVGWRTLERVSALAACLVLFVWIVINFDILLMQVQLAEMMGLAKHAGHGVFSTAEVLAPDELFRQYGHTGAVLVLKGLTYFYVGLLLVSAYMLHVSYHAMLAEIASWRQGQEAGAVAHRPGGGAQPVEAGAEPVREAVGQPIYADQTEPVQTGVPEQQPPASGGESGVRGIEEE